MYDIEIDRRKNRMVIDLSGRLDAETISEAATTAVEEAEHLSEGFDIITDLSGFAPPKPEAATPIKEAQGKLKEMGVDRVVRVTDEDTSNVVVTAFERRSRNVGYSGETADSRNEAEELLNQELAKGHF